MKTKLIFAWYDLWVGFFWDSSKRKLYFFPIPMFGIVIHFHKWVVKSSDINSMYHPDTMLHCKFCDTKKHNWEHKH